MYLKMTINFLKFKFYFGVLNFFNFYLTQDDLIEDDETGDQPLKASPDADTTFIFTKPEGVGLGKFLNKVYTLINDIFKCTLCKYFLFDDN